MNQFWRRAYRLTIGDDDETLEIDGTGDTPAEISFTVSVQPGGVLKIASITVYGLNRDSRRRVYDRYTRVSLAAGFGDDVPTIFNGRLYNVAVGREGPDSFVTLYCRSAGRLYEAGFINRAWGAGTPAKEVIEDTATAMGLPVSFVGDFSDLPSVPYGLTASKDAKLFMRDLAKNYNFWWLIEDEQITITRLGASRDMIHQISSESGMVGTPQITQRGVDVTSKMLPSVRPFDEVEVVNATSEITFSNPNAASYQDTLGAGRYQVISVTHTGSFSGDRWDTVLECLNTRQAQLQRIQPR